MSRNVRFEKRAREFIYVARLILEAEAQASLKGRESHDWDPKPGDLFLSKAKFPEREMEAWTSAVYMRLDDLGIGVKSHSNSAMAGSCRNIPSYSLILSCIWGKVRIAFAEEFSYGTLSNSEPIRWKMRIGGGA